MNATQPLPPTRDRAACVSVVPGGPVQGSLRPPGSKSLTNRAVLCAAFAAGKSTLSGALGSEDTHVMMDSLAKIGVKIETLSGGTVLSIEGLGGRSPDDSVSGETKNLFIANSGTTVRFLTAALSAYGGNFLISGVERMHERPIGDLVDAIDRVIQGAITADSPGGCPPVSMNSRGWDGSTISVAGNISSQYLSGLMMAAPIASKGVRVEVVGDLVSRPYVDMTVSVMEAFGAMVDIDEDPLSFAVSGDYAGISYAIEPDASAASYFWAAAAVTGGDVLVQGLSKEALQGDVGLVDVLEQMGCEIQSEHDGIRVRGGELRGVDVNMESISDTVQTLAVVALFASGPTRVRGVAHNRFKETDRIGNLAIELRKLGATIDEHEDGLTIHPLPSGHQLDEPVRLDTYNDHRMAMSFAVAGLRLANVLIENPACTGKTYPKFWMDLETLLGRGHHWFSGEDTDR